MTGKGLYLLLQSCFGGLSCYWRNATLVLALALLSISAKSQSEDTYDEISVVLNVQRIGSTEIPAIIHNQEAYLPVKEIFDFLKIKNTMSPDFDLITGFFITPQAKFIVDKAKKEITYQGKTIKLEQNDLIQTENNLYLKSEYFGSVFGLECTFNFRDLSITLVTKIELPVIREMQQELIRKNVSRLKGEKKADTTIKRTYPKFHLGMADWSVVSTQQTGVKPYTRVNFALGTNIFGGEANAYLNYTAGQPFDKKQQYYNWRFVNNDNKVLRQVTAGRLFSQSISSVFSPLTGVQISNTPTTYRRSYGTYTLSNKTEPGWIVELYINNVLVNFMKADASGFYSFEVPMVYGSSVVKLRFYGPWGEERTSEQYINIPFNFMPEHQFEYTVTAGQVSDENKSLFARATLNYGLSKRITIGGGAEYFSSLSDAKIIPYVNASMRVGSRLLFTAERVHGVRSTAIASYRSPSNLQFDYNYSRYDPGQMVVKYNYLEERKAVISVPIRGKKYSAFSRLTIDQVTLPKSKFTSAEMLISAVMPRMSANLTTYAVITEKKPFVYSNLAVSFRLPKGLKFTPQAQYEYRESGFSILRAEVEKSITNKGYMNFSYEKNNFTHSQSFALGLRYNFSFAQTFFNVRQSQHETNMMQSARGSLIYDHSNNILSANAVSNVGRGGVIILPYLDLNCNGERDENEPKADGLQLRVNGGRIEHNKKDTTIRIVGLEAYNDYFIELDKASFDNVAWQMPKQTIKVAVDPNYFKLVEVAIAVVGEVSGAVLLDDKSGRNGLGRVIVNLYNSRSKLVAKILTESDGFFSFSGLAPGKYTASIDENQLTKLKMSTSAVKIPFTIKSSLEGDVEDGLEFVLKKNPKAD